MIYAIGLWVALAAGFIAMLLVVDGDIHMAAYLATILVLAIGYCLNAFISYLQLKKFVAIENFNLNFSQVVQYLIFCFIIFIVPIMLASLNIFADYLSVLEVRLTDSGREGSPSETVSPDTMRPEVVLIGIIVELSRNAALVFIAVELSMLYWYFLQHYPKNQILGEGGRNVVIGTAIGLDVSWVVLLENIDDSFLVVLELAVRSAENLNFVISAAEIGSICLFCLSLLSSTLACYLIGQVTLTGTR